MVQYILECIAFQLVFLIVYDFFLRKETFFQWNRLYLLGTHVLSLFLPWVKIEALKTTVSVEPYVYPEFLWNMQNASIELSTTEASWIHLSWQEGVFILGVLAAFALFVYKMWQLYRFRKNGQIHYFSEFTQIVVSNSNLTFSFFKSIFLGDKVVKDEQAQIIQHELVHIKQHHSLDLLFFELLRIVCWFNPLVYLYQNRISELHEFIADAKVAKINKKEQYQLLLSQVFQTQHISFVNQFFNSSLIKKRIGMLQRSRSKKVWQLKYLFLLPIVMGMLFYTSLEGQETTAQENKEDQRLIEKIREEIKKDIENTGSMKELLSIKAVVGKYNAENSVLSKEDFFRRHILWKEMGKEINRKNYKGALKSHLEDLYDPSTLQYNSYVNRAKVFELLDRNLDISIDMRKYDVIIIKQKDNNTNDSYVFKVVDITDLTADEIRSFNAKMEDVFEKNSTYDNIILTDNANVVRIVKKVGNDDNRRSAIRDKNVEAKYNQLLKERERLLKNSNENNPIIENLDQQLRGLKQQISTSNENVEEKYNQLLKERERLLKNSNENNPIIENLDQQLRGLEQQISTNNENVEEKYNQLLKERERLLKNSNENNPIIENLDQQLRGLKQQISTNNDESVPFALVDEVPIFPGCEGDDDKRACFQTNMQEHISKNFKYPEEAKKAGIQGRVNVMFTINEDGNIVDIRKRGPHKLLEDEAVRIIKLIPQLKVGNHKGKNVNVPFSIPITFKL